MRRILPLLTLTLFALVGCKNPVAEKLDEAKEDAAWMKADQLRMFSTAYAVRNDDQPLTTLDDLVPYAEDGEKVLTDPWGQKYQFRYVERGKDESPLLVIWTTHPKTGKVFAAPRDMADKVPAGK